MKILYYIIWITCVAVTMIAVATLVGSIIGFESVGVKGITAGAGIAVISAKRNLFTLLDKMFKQDQ